METLKNIALWGLAVIGGCIDTGFVILSIILIRVAPLALLAWFIFWLVKPYLA